MSGSGAYLTDAVYDAARALRKDPAARQMIVAFVDESGEDYLYPAEWFVAVEVPKAVQASLLKAS